MVLWMLDVPAQGDSRAVSQEWENGWRNTLIEAKGRGRGEREDGRL